MAFEQLVAEAAIKKEKDSKKKGKDKDKGRDKAQTTKVRARTPPLSSYPIQSRPILP